MKKRTRPSTSWNKKTGKWYSRLVGEKGHYYQQRLIFPKSLGLLEIKKDASILDIGCGEGVFARYLPKEISYLGVDNSQFLINEAKRKDENINHQFVVASAEKPLPIEKNDFSHAVAILSLQNMRNPEKAIFQASKHLKIGGRFLIVLNHPCFRIPRQSGWGINESNKMQYRWINKYLSFLEIPIDTAPGRKSGPPIAWSFHYPINKYSLFLNQAGFLIEKIEEWFSDKESQGKTAKMENRSRAEIPLFLAILCRKV